MGKTTNMQDCTKAIRVLLIDARPVFLVGLANLINAEKPRMEVVGQACSYGAALELSDRLHPDVVLFSFFQDTLDPLEVISALSCSAGMKVLVMKGLYEDLPIAKAMDAGARGFILAENPTESLGRAIAKVHAQGDRTNQVWVSGLSHLASQGAAPPAGDHEQARLTRLTVRERELIRAIVANPSAKYIAIGAQLGISEHTVHNHLSSIYNKLGLINRLDLLVYAMKHQISDDNDSAASRWVDLS